MSINLRTTIGETSPRPVSGGSADMPLTNGQKIAFLGDSITANGSASASGFVNQVVSGLGVNGIAITALAAGGHGHTSRELLARLTKDILAKRPDWVVLSCGVNDITDRAWGVALADFGTNVGAILDAAAAAKVQALVLTATPSEPDLDSVANRKLETYNGVLRALAAARGARLADAGADLRAAIATCGKGCNRFTVDGVHLSPHGNLVMAKTVLRAFGLNEVQMRKAEEAWLDQPQAVAEVLIPLNLSLRQYLRLEAAAAKTGKSVREFLSELLATQTAPLLLSDPP